MKPYIYIKPCLYDIQHKAPAAVENRKKTAYNKNNTIHSTTT